MHVVTGKRAEAQLDFVYGTDRDNAFEPLDGQQRLTTLYLIYKYMKNVNPFFSEPAFSLTYETREQSADFLKTIDLLSLIADFVILLPAVLFLP